LITEIEKKYNQDHGKMNRYFYGVSNGAGFGMSLLNSNPEVIGTYFCFSTFGGDIESNSWNKKIIYPNLYLKYGSDEHFFLKNDAAFLKVKYKKTHSFLEVKEFKGGHNNLYWNQEFIEIISKLFR
jgi:predicted alpha/beta superfamily hydrolase